jgi:hypothetical protein
MKTVIEREESWSGGRLPAAVAQRQSQPVSRLTAPAARSGRRSMAQRETQWPALSLKF